MTRPTPAEALAMPVDVALADLLKFEFHFRTTGNPIVAKQIRDIHATLARAVEVGSELLAADLQYDDARRKWHRCDGTLDECEKRMAEAEERRENAIDTARGVGSGA